MRTIPWLMRFLVLVLFAPIADAQTDIQVQAQIEPRVAYLGSSLVYTVSVQTIGQHDIGEPQIDMPPGLRVKETKISFEQRQSPVRQPDGTFQLNVVLRRSFHYSLSADRIGTIVIPPTEVLVDGKPYRTESVSFNVREPQAIEGFGLETRLSKTRVFVGEPFTLSMTWFVGQDVRDFSFVGPELPSTVEAEPIFSTQAPQDRAGRYPGTTLYGERIYGTPGEATYQGRRVSTVTFQVQYTSRTAGILELGPMAMIFDAVEGRSITRGIARSDAITVKVLPLPTAGRPSGSTGLIGSYRITSSALPDEVNVGDPVELVVRIEGPDARLVKDGPNLAAMPGFADRFKFDPAGWERVSGTNTVAAFRTTIRALDESITSIPPVELPYFDSTEGAYLTARSMPIPIVVRPSRVVSLDDAIISPGLTPLVARQDLGAAHSGLWAIAPVEVLASQHRGPVPYSWFLAFAIAPPGLWLFMVIHDWRARRADRPSAIQKRAYRSAMRLARRGEGERAVRLYLGERLGQRPDAVTAADCHLAIQDETLAGEARSWLGAAEATRFGQIPLLPPDEQRAVALIRSIHAAMRERT